MLAIRAWLLRGFLIFAASFGDPKITSGVDLSVLTHSFVYILLLHLVLSDLCVPTIWNVLDA